MPRPQPAVVPLAGLLALLAGCARVDETPEAEATVEQSQSSSARHLLLVLEVKHGTVSLSHPRWVFGPAPQRRGAPAHPWRLVAEDNRGRELERIALPELDVVHGEFAQPDGTLEAHHAPLPETSALIRLSHPSSVARLRLEARAKGPQASADQWVWLGSAEMAGVPP